MYLYTHPNENSIATLTASPPSTSLLENFDFSSNCWTTGKMLRLLQELPPPSYDVSRTALGLTLTIIPCITGSISFVSSSFLIWSIWREKTFHRPREMILIWLSFLDLLFSSACAMSTFTAPADLDPFTEYVLLGNVATCNMQGWLYQAGTTVPMYNTLLSTYYLLCVRYRKTDEELRKCFLPTMYVLLLCWSFGSASAGLLLGIYNFGGIMGCWIDNSHIPLCEQGYNLESCGRGADDNMYIWLFGGFPVLSSFAGTIFATCMLYGTTRSQEIRARRKDLESSGCANASRRSIFSDGDQLSEEETPHATVDSTVVPYRCCSGLRVWVSRRCRRVNSFKMSTKVLESGLLYVVAFWVTYTPFLVLGICSSAGVAVPDWVRIADVILLPLQGFFNVLIYKLPQWRQQSNQRKTQGQIQLTGATPDNVESRRSDPTNESPRSVTAIEIGSE